MTNHHWHIRRAHSSDAGALVSCIDAAYAQYKHNIPDLPAVSDGCEEEIAKNRVWVALNEVDLVGCLFLVPDKRFMKLANVAVHPEHSGKGLGRELMKLAEREARNHSADELRLTTHVAMPDNIRLYTRLGWKEVARSGNSVSMTKLL